MELIIEGTVGCWAYFAEWICKGKPLSKNTKDRIKGFVGLFACLGLISVFLGIVALTNGDFLNKTAGICLTVIPPVLAVAQIIAGFIIKKKKK